MDQRSSNVVAVGISRMVGIASRFLRRLNEHPVTKSSSLMMSRFPCQRPLLHARNVGTTKRTIGLFKLVEAMKGLLNFIDVRIHRVNIHGAITADRMCTSSFMMRCSVLIIQYIIHRCECALDWLLRSPVIGNVDMPV